MSYNHRLAVIAAEDHVLQLGKLLEKGSLSDLIHPDYAKSEQRWRDAGFVILRNEAEEKESDEKLRRIYTPLARELSGFMYRITDGAMSYILKNTDYDTFFQPIAQILADYMVKPHAKNPKPKTKSVPESPWELRAMRAIVTYALNWLKKVKPKVAQFEVDDLIEESSVSFEEYLRRKARRNSNPEKEAEKAAEALSRSMEELAAGFKGLAESTSCELRYIAGIPGYLTPKVWFPQLNPFLRITEKHLEKVNKTLIRLKLDPAPAMSLMWSFYYTGKRRKR
jgi:hypothetical protein